MADGNFVTAVVAALDAVSKVSKKKGGWGATYDFLGKVLFTALVIGLILFAIFS